MVFTIVNSIEFTFRKYENMKMVLWLITTHFVVEDQICVMCTLTCDCAIISRSLWMEWEGNMIMRDMCALTCDGNSKTANTHLPLKTKVAKEINFLKP